VQQAADDGLRRALDDLDHAAFGPALAVVPHDAAARGPCAAPRASRSGAGRCRFAVVADHVAVAVAVALDHSFDFVEEAGAVVLNF
jgi:hypothetical protein